MVHSDADELVPAEPRSTQLRPASNVSLSVGPSIGHDEGGVQYVAAVYDTAAAASYGRRYVFADLVKSLSVEQGSPPLSIASAARCASGRRGRRDRAPPA